MDLSLVLFQVIVLAAVTSRCYTSEQECGQRPVLLQNRMLGGEITTSEKWPWHATITQRTRNVLKVVCGGSIIDRFTILTAAHCLYTEDGVISTNRLIVHVGRSDLFVTDPHTKVYIPDEFLIHPGHRSHSVMDDIALIRLRNEIELNDYVQPVCVCSDVNDTEIVGRYGMVVGFGLNINGTMSDHLVEAEVPVVDRWDCFESNRDVFSSHLTRKMLCAGERNAVGPCNGDSGGGFVFLTGDRWCVRGIVSFTPNLYETSLCDPEQYVVYTDVAKYADWLQINTKAMYHWNVRHYTVNTIQSQKLNLPPVKVFKSSQTDLMVGPFRCPYYVVVTPNVEIEFDSCMLSQVKVILYVIQVKNDVSTILYSGAKSFMFVHLLFKRA